MDSSVRSRPNHYEMLGLEPVASADEIDRAFAREMRIAGAQPIGAAARICAAYETLRNPAKRRDYDRSIGIVPEPKPQPRQWAFPAPQPHWSPLVASARPAAAAPAEAAAEPDPFEKRASSIAETLRELARPAALDAAPEAKTAPAPAPPRKEATHYEIEPDIRQLLAERRADEEAEEDHERAFDWRRPVLAVGGLLVAAGLIGAMAGLWVRDDVEPAQAEASAAASVPAAKSRPTVVAAPAGPAAEPFEAVDMRRPPARTKRTAPSRQIAERPAVESGAAENRFVESATEAAIAAAPDAISDPAPAPAPAAAAADLPIPGKVIARTIERIGYSCGSVASATAVDGASGAFKVTCSSGQTYRAAPVHGRYRFKRWSGD